jgi:uncharacterized protein (DUF433 family)
MTKTTETHISLDERGRPWVDGTNTKVIEIVLDKLAYGWSPEEMCLQHPHLTLAHVHSALAYYYDHQAEIDTEIARQVETFDALRAAASNSTITQKLKAAKAARQLQK